MAHSDFLHPKPPPSQALTQGEAPSLNLAPIPTPRSTTQATPTDLPSFSQFHDCWNQVGVVGDHTCPQLETVIHCQNCSIYSAAGRSLLERPAPLGYLEDWQRVLGESKAEPEQRELGADRALTATQTLIIFRLGQETLAFPVALLQQVTPPAIVHRVPHRQNSVLLGLVNVRGEILLCLSLAALLAIAAPSPTLSQTNAQPRWLVMGEAAHPWVTPVDEVYGIYRVQIPSLEAPPIVVTQATTAYTRGIVSWKGGKATVLDGDRLLAAFQQVSG